MGPVGRGAGDRAFRRRRRANRALLSGSADRRRGTSGTEFIARPSHRGRLATRSSRCASRCWARRRFTRDSKYSRNAPKPAARRSWPVEFTLIGNVETAIQHGCAAFTETGRYEQADLPAILERVAPHIVWFPGRVPETFSYTLSTCLEWVCPWPRIMWARFPSGSATGRGRGSSRADTSRGGMGRVLCPSPAGSFPDRERAGSAAGARDRALPISIRRHISRRTTPVTASRLA